MAEELLIPRKQYLSTGIQFGRVGVNKKMKRFIYKIKPNGIAIFDLKKIDERIRIIGKFLANHDVYVTTRKKIAFQALEKFGKITGIKVHTGRFLPGTFTNPSSESFYEPDALFVVDPVVDKQAIREAIISNIPIIAICDSKTDPADIDIILPANNRGKRSLFLIFWLLAREVLKIRGEIKSYEEFKPSYEEFLEG